MVSSFFKGWTSAVVEVKYWQLLEQTIKQRTTRWLVMNV